MQFFNMYWLSIIFIVATLHLQQYHVKAKPIYSKNTQQVAQNMDWDNVMKLDFLPNGIRKELNFDVGLFAVRSRQTLKYGADVDSVGDIAISRRKKRALNGLQQVAPCHTGGTGGGTADYEDIAGRRRSSKKGGKAISSAKSILNKYKKKKKLVDDDEHGPQIQHRRRREVDNENFSDKAKDFMERTKKSFLGFIDKIRQFSADVVQKIKN